MREVAIRGRVFSGFVLRGRVSLVSHSLALLNALLWHAHRLRWLRVPRRLLLRWVGLGVDHGAVLHEALPHFLLVRVLEDHLLLINLPLSGRNRLVAALLSLWSCARVGDLGRRSEYLFRNNSLQDARFFRLPRLVPDFLHCLLDLGRGHPRSVLRDFDNFNGLLRGPFLPRGTSCFSQSLVWRVGRNVALVVGASQAAWLGRVDSYMLVGLALASFIGDRHVGNLVILVQEILYGVGAVSQTADVPRLAGILLLVGNSRDVDALGHCSLLGVELVPDLRLPVRLSHLLLRLGGSRVQGLYLFVANGIADMLLVLNSRFLRHSFNLFAERSRRLAS